MSSLTSATDYEQREIANLLKKTLQGVFSVDTVSSKPRILVVNTDKSTTVVEHLIAELVDGNGFGENFHSFGRTSKRTFKRYVYEYCTAWTVKR